jgi:predicted DNA-binding protein (MmcQ/YjbR family)
MMALGRNDLRAYCLSKGHVTEEFPFGEDPVYKVGGKIFAIVSAGDDAETIALKCDPKLVPLLRGTYPAVTTAPYLHKAHWNKVLLDGSIPDDEVLEMVDASYALIVKALPKAGRERLMQSD